MRISPQVGMDGWWIGSGRVRWADPDEARAGFGERLEVH